MFKYILCIMILFCAILPLSGCVDNGSPTITTEQYYNVDPNVPINASVGNEFVILMQSESQYSPITGWKTDYDSSVLLLVDETVDYIDVQNPDAGYDYFFKFKALEKGQTKVNMKYLADIFTEDGDIEITLVDWVVFTVQIR